MLHLKFILAAIVLLLSSVLQAQTSWTVTRTNLLGVNFAYSVAFGNGRFVVTLASATNANPPLAAAWSTDGLTWRASTLRSPTQGAVVFASGAFYLAGGAGIWRSTDGDTWQQVYSATGSNVSFRGIASDGRSLLVSQGSINSTTLYYSPDLVTWRETATLPGSGPPNPGTFHGSVASANGRYYLNYSVQLPNGNLTTHAVATTDGTQWAPVAALAPAFYLTGGNGRVVAVAANQTGVYSLASPDGIAFVTTPLNGPITNGGSMGFAGGRYFLLGTLNASLDGIAWAPLAPATLTALGQMVGVAYGNGRYVAVGYGGGASPVDVIAVLSANAPPVITADPTDRAAPDGGRTTFSVTYDNPGLVTTFQWLRNGVAIPGATSATYTLDPVRSADTGRFSVVLRNPVGSATSTPATLTIGLPPTIAVGPASAVVLAGTTTVLSVSANGTAPFAYQWLRNGTPVPGATGSFLILDSTLFSDAGAYTVTITNLAGSVTSPAAILTVQAPPAIATVPASLTVIAGARSTLSVTATGTAPLTYQWLRNGTPIAGATGSSFTLDSTLPSDAGAYTVTIGNAFGTIATAFATLTVTPISRISNISVLTALTTATDSFTLGYVVGGTGSVDPKPLVIRAAGPSLTALGVPGILDDPMLEIFAGPIKTGENDNWGGSPSLAASLANVGAFPYSSPLSKDSASVIATASRDNSIRVSSTDRGTGQVIAEIYDATPPANFTSATPRLLNVSVLKSLGTGLTVGFTLAGSSAKTVLIRAIGPTLGVFGVTGVLADPQLRLFNSGGTQINLNDDWGGTAALSSAFTSVGAFALGATSKDAALVVSLAPGSYTAQVSGVGGTTGVALVEVYELP